MNVNNYVDELGIRARDAAKSMSLATRGQKDEALHEIAHRLQANSDEILKENHKDMEAGKAKGLEDSLLDRLQLNEDRLSAMALGCEQVAALPDPIGEIKDLSYRPSGIQVGRMRVPLGVIGIIYESRPNVTIDAAALCLKSGNATILRGGSEAICSNRAIATVINRALESTQIDANAVQLIETVDRDAVARMISSAQLIDVIIPRGGKGLIERITKDAKIPVIKHLDGICHVYLDKDADLEKAFDIALNSKTHRYGVCNAMETLLVHSELADKVLPQLAEAYIEKGVELRVCAESVDLLPGIETKLADEDDWSTEYLAPILSIKVVANYTQTIDHIAKYSSGHTESIVTENITTGRRFLAEVDSSSVMVNASTRFADGFEYGLGAEIGISTDKLHARGPVGLEGLTSQKYVVYGDGHIRS